MINPGLRFAFTKKGFKYLAQVGVSMLETQLKKIKIPDTHGNVDSPIGLYTGT